MTFANATGKSSDNVYKFLTCQILVGDFGKRRSSKNSQNDIWNLQNLSLLGICKSPIKDEDLGTPSQGTIENSQILRT